MSNLFLHTEKKDSYHELRIRGLDNDTLKLTEHFDHFEIFFISVI